MKLSFGDTLWTSKGTMNRDNFDGSTYDSESDLQMLGFRMYDNETGRFTTPDLLWSAFPAQTPYHYAYNSPLTYRDPSGLAPEKEKEGERLQSWENNWGAIYPLHAAMWEENERRLNQRVGRFGSSSQAMTQIYDLMAGGWTNTEAQDMYFNGERTGDGGSEIGLTPWQKSKVELSISLSIGAGVSNGDQVKANFWSSFWEANGAMTKKQFEYHTSGMITVKFLSDSEFLAHSTQQGSPTAHGWHLGKNGQNTITLQASMFVDKNINSIKFAHLLNDPNNTITGTKQGYEINRVDVLQHEFGHGFAYYLFGDEYNSWNYNYKENWAYWYVNETYRIPHGMDTWAFQGGNFFNWFPFFYRGMNPVSNDLK